MRISVFVYFVSRLELPIVVTLFLNGIICQVNQSIRHIFQIEVLAACSQVPFIIPVADQIPIH